MTSRKFEECLTPLPLLWRKCSFDLGLQKLCFHPPPASPYLRDITNQCSLTRISKTSLTTKKPTQTFVPLGTVSTGYQTPKKLSRRQKRLSSWQLRLVTASVRNSMQTKLGFQTTFSDPKLKFPKLDIKLGSQHHKQLSTFVIKRSSLAASGFQFYCKTCLTVLKN